MVVQNDIWLMMAFSLSQATMAAASMMRCHHESRAHLNYFHRFLAGIVRNDRRQTIIIISFQPKIWMRSDTTRSHFTQSCEHSHDQNGQMSRVACFANGCPKMDAAAVATFRHQPNGVRQMRVECAWGWILDSSFEKQLFPKLFWNARTRKQWNKSKTKVVKWCGLIWVVIQYIFQNKHQSICNCI